MGFGLTLAVGSVLVLGLLVNLVAAALLAFTIFFYVVIYTMWLKRCDAAEHRHRRRRRRLSADDRLGGGDGLASISASIALFLIIFMWTPPHFWALALFREGDYARAGVPDAAGRRRRRRDPPADPPL